MARIFLHIGTEKTGTTTLQAFLTANEAALARSGLTLSFGSSRPYFERMAHGPLAACLMAERAEFISDGKHQPAEFVLDMLRRDIDRGGRDVILSCEQFSSRITSAASLRRLVDALADHDVTVVCYLRRQDELAIAAYTTAVRSGRRTIKKQSWDPHRTCQQKRKEQIRFAHLIRIFASPQKSMTITIQV